VDSSTEELSTSLITEALIVLKVVDKLQKLPGVGGFQFQSERLLYLATGHREPSSSMEVGLVLGGTLLGVVAVRFIVVTRSRGERGGAYVFAYLAGDAIELLCGHCDHLLRSEGR
jgi:hypothetical protein